MVIEIYTDGGCRNNPGPGGYAFVVTDGKTPTFTECWATPDTTNNQMELLAIYRALLWVNENLPGETKITIYSDSQYAINCISKWYTQWKKENTLAKKKNIQIIESIMKIKSPGITFQWIRGHSDNRFNELADSLVNQVIDSLPVAPDYF